MRASILSFLLAFVAWPTSVHAESNRAAATEADTLFREGKARLAAGDYLTACPLLAASFAKDPATGTLLALAVCHERQSDLVSALREYREVVQRAHAEGRGDRRDAAQARVTALEALANTNAPAVTVHVEPVAAPVAEVTEEAVAPTPEETPAPPVVEPAPVAAMEVPAPAPRAPTSAPSRSEGGMSIVQGAGWATVGLGVFGLGTSLALTLQAIGKNEDSKDGCVVNRCTPEGAKDRNDARAAGTAATITGVLAAALIAGGISMVLLGGPSDDAPTRATAHIAPWLMPQLFGASATGTF